MDLSKLPKLSETNKHAPPPAPRQQQQADPLAPSEFTYVSAAAPSAGPEVWLGIAIGVLIQFLNTRFWTFVGNKLFGSRFTWTFTDTDGSPMAYVDSVYFFGDVVIVLFGLVLILEGVAMMFSNRVLMIKAAFGLTVFTTVLNVIYLLKMMSSGYGLQLYAALAIIFGVYIAMHQWRLIMSHRALRRA